MSETPYVQRMVEKLTRAFHPTSLVVRDDSHHHAGHGGANPLGETHFHITIDAPAFHGLSRVAQHRLIYQVLAEELKERVHALSLEVGGAP
ncbi:MAG: BolA family protein [Alphaproteobacteria bacterium]